MKDGRPSQTAQRVAAHRLGFPRVAASFGDAAADDALARDVAGSFAGEPPSSSASMVQYLAARTAFFDGVVVAALERGVSQIVITAAGYDGRALRYAKPGVRWFEVDHPDTQRDKLARLRRLGVEPVAVTFVPADFAVDDVAAALAGAGHRSEVATLFLCEGVAVYLPVEVLASLLAGLRRASVTAESCVAISMSTDAPADRRRRFEAAVAAMGEPARSHLTPNAAGALFAGAGWRPVAIGPEASEGGAGRTGFVVLEPTGPSGGPTLDP